MKTPAFLAAALASLLLLAASAAGQTTPATATAFADTITGQVAADGLAIPGVTVTITDVASGQRLVTTTDDAGRFSATVAHPGSFTIQAAMVAFAPAEVTVNVPASGAAVPLVSLPLRLASQVEVAPLAAAPASAAVPAANRAAPAPAASRSAAANANRGRGARGAAQAGSFQQLDISQTGEISGDANAGASDSGVAGMSDAAATDSAVVAGSASQDERPMDANSIQAMLRQAGIGPGGGPGAAGAFGGAPGGGGFGGGPGGGGRGGFGGGRGGFGGGRGGFNFRQMQNRFNQPHGTLSYTLGDSALNALRDSITGASSNQNPPHAANQRYTATVTTPLKIPGLFDDHGKTSLTFSYNGQHDASLDVVSARVPTLAERQGNFQGLTDRQGNPVIIKNPATGQPYSGNTITPGDISGAAQALLAYLPLPTPGAAGAFNYTNTLNTLSVNNSFSLRLNHSFGAASAGGRGGRGFGGRGGRSLNFSLNYSGGNAHQPGVFFPFVSGLTTTRGLNTRLGYNQPLAGWINNFSVTYNRSRNHATNLYANQTDVAALAGIQGVSTAPVDWGLPTLQFASSGLTSLHDVAPSFLRSQTWSFSDGMIRRLGRHNIRFGGDFRRLQVNPATDASPNGVFTFNGQYSGYDFADFLLGMAQQTSERYGGGTFYFRQTEPDLYFNDNWQMAGGFTLSYGLRWEYVSPYTELHSRLTNLLTSSDFSTLTPAVVGQNGVPDTVIKPEYTHLRPSLGFAWSTWQNMIVTGGFGMAYNTGAYANLATALAYQSPFLINQANVAAASPLPLANGFQGGNVSVHTYGVDPNYQMGYSTLWTLDVQRQMGRAFVLNLDYSGAKGTHLDQLRAPNRTAGGLLYPNLQPFLYDTSGGNSLYNGGSVIVSRRLSQSVGFRARYTYSKMMDDASQIGGGGGLNGQIAQNDLNLGAERSLSSGNVTHAFNTSYEWQLPYGLNHRWGDHTNFWSSALGDWQLTGQFTANSGQPLTPIVNNAAATAQGLQALGVNAPLRPNLTGVAIANSSPALLGFFNTAAFSAPAPGTYGDAGRNSIIGPGAIQLDAALSKSFRMGEFRSLEIRFDAANVLNHPNWSGVDTNFSSLTFGDVTSFGAPRQITFTARFRY
jgi:hypothetical protein